MMDFLKNNRLFSFSYGDKNFRDCPMETKISENGDSIVFEYLLPDGLKVTNTAKKYEKFNAYEWVLSFENTGSIPTQIIHDLNDSDVTLPFAHDERKTPSAYIRDPKNNMKIYSYSGSMWETNEFYCDIDKYYSNEYINHIYPGDTKIHKTAGGRSSQGKAPYFNIHRQGRGVIFAIGWTGQWMCTIYRGEDDVNIKTKIEDTHFYLLPGEKIRTSSFVMMPYEGSYIDSQNKWRRLVKEHFSLIGRPGRAQTLPFCAGIWGGMPSGAVIKRVNAIKENKLPFEYIWMDAGWYGDATRECIDEFEGDWGGTHRELEGKYYLSPRPVAGGPKGNQGCRSEIFALA